MKTFAHILQKTLWWLVYALPVVLFFSYHPVISLGGNSSMNFELSLPLIWLVIFDLLAFIYILVLHGRRWWGISDRRFFLFALFPLYATLSIFWSANPLRGILTAGVMWLVFFAVFALLFVLPQTGTPRRLRTHVLIAMFVAAVLVCKFCYAQSIMDVLGVSRDYTLLCRGCTYRSFGFPHPSGFAIEPQFMGNLLLAPALTALYMVVFRPRKFAKNMVGEAEYLEHQVEQKVLHDRIKLPEPDWKRWQYIGMIILAGFLATTLFFTFSRGAIYAYGVAIIILLIYALKRKRFQWKLIGIPAVGLVLALSLQGIFAEVGPTAETFTSAVTKSIHQLSLGIIDLRQLAATTETDLKAVENSEQTVDNSAENVDKTQDSVDKTSENVEKLEDNCGKPVDNTTEKMENFTLNCAKPVQNHEKVVENIAETVDKSVENHEEKSKQSSEKALEDAIFEGYVPESTNIRLALNQAALQTWFKAPGHWAVQLGATCVPEQDQSCFSFTPSSILWGVGLGGAGVAMHAAVPETVTSPKEIVQHEGFSLLLETGLTGAILVVLALLIAFWPQLFSEKFLDGKMAGREPLERTVWQHPARPLLVALVVAYLITLNFFSGLPNALQIYLMPPLIYLIFNDQYMSIKPAKSPRQSRTHHKRRSRK